MEIEGGNKAVFAHTLSSQPLILSRFSTRLYNYALWHQISSGLKCSSSSRPLISADYRSSCRVARVSVLLQVFLCRVDGLLIWHLCFFIPASPTCSIWPWREERGKSFFSSQNMKQRDVCDSRPEPLGRILTVLNIRSIDSGIRCTPLPRLTAKSRDSTERRIIRSGFMMKSLVRRACFPVWQPKLS